MAEARHGRALRFDTSIGLTLARPAQMMEAPAIGDIERPIAPAICASEPRSMIERPNCSANGVMAPLKAKAAASPEPEMTAMKNGPNVPAAAAAVWDPSMSSVSAPVRPMAVMPVVKTLAQTMRPMTSA